MQKIKTIISSLDLFPTSVNLRAGGSDTLTNPSTGIFSILLYILVLYLLIKTLITTFTLQNITASEVTKINDNQEEIIEDIVVGIGLQYMSLANMLQYFSVQAFIVDAVMSSTPIPVVPCTRDMWAELSDDQYNSLSIQNGMCIPKENAKTSKFSGVAGATGVYLMLSRSSNRIFACSMFVLQAGINPNSPNPIEYTINEKTLWLIFSEYQSIIVQNYVGKFQITTDRSFLPWTDEETVEGYQFTEVVTASVMNLTPSSILVEIFIFGSPKLTIINRSFGKIDEILGYVGGLFGLLVAFFAIFLSSYNDLRYQLYVSSVAFKFKQNKQTNISNFTFLKYIKYKLFEWLKIIFCYQPNWQDCKTIQKATSQASNQIQLGIIMNRLSYLDKAMETLIQNNLQLLLHLSDTHSIQEVSKRRAILEYYTKFSEGEMYATMVMMDNGEKDKDNRTLSTQGSVLFNGLVQPTSFFELKENKNQVAPAWRYFR